MGRESQAGGEREGEMERGMKEKEREDHLSLKKRLHAVQSRGCNNDEKSQRKEDNTEKRDKMSGTASPGQGGERWTVQRAQRRERQSTCGQKYNRVYARASWCTWWIGNMA